MDWKIDVSFLWAVGTTVIGVIIYIVRIEGKVRFLQKTNEKQSKDIEDLKIATSDNDVIRKELELTGEELKEIHDEANKINVIAKEVELLRRDIFLGLEKGNKVIALEENVKLLREEFRSIRKRENDKR